MDALTFISKVIGDMAWPISVIVMVLLLKKPLVELLHNIRHFKYKDAEFDFGKAMTDIRGAEPAPTKQLPITSSQLKLAELSPRGAILEAWLELEDALANAAETEGASRTRPGGLSGKPVPVDSWTFAQLLAVSGKLSSTSYERFQKLRQIRNKAVHATDEAISQEDAETFIRLVEELKLEVKNA